MSTTIDHDYREIANKVKIASLQSFRLVDDTVLLYKILPNLIQCDKLRLDNKNLDVNSTQQPLSQLKKSIKQKILNYK